MLMRIRLTIFLAVIVVLCSCRASNAPESPGEEANVACATIGDITIEFSKAYEFMPLTYEGVDYWHGESKKHFEKGCQSKAKQITISTSWPSLKPGPRLYELVNDPDLIKIVLDKSYGVNPSDAMEKMRNAYLTNDWSGSRPEKAKELGAKKFWFDDKVGLMTSGEVQSKRFKKLVYWKESPQKKIELLILCRAYPSGALICQEKWFSEKWNIWLTIEFRKPILTQWHKMHIAVENLVGKFIKKD